MLLIAKANPNVQDKWQKTALIYVCENPNISILSEELSMILALFIFAGADISNLSSNGLKDPFIQFAIKLRNFIMTNQSEDLSIKQALENVWNQKEDWKNNLLSNRLDILSAFNSAFNTVFGTDTILTIELALMLGINLQSFAIQYFEEICKEYHKLIKKAHKKMT